MGGDPVATWRSYFRMAVSTYDRRIGEDPQGDRPGYAWLWGLFKSGLMVNDLNNTAVEGYRAPLKEGKTRVMYYFYANLQRLAELFRNT